MQTLGLHVVVLAAGEHHLSRHQPSEPDLSGEAAAAMARALTALPPGVPGPLCIGQPALYQLMIERAEVAGAAERSGA